MSKDLAKQKYFINNNRSVTKPIAITTKIDAIALFLAFSDILDQKCIVKNMIIVTARPIRMYFGIKVF